MTVEEFHGRRVMFVVMPDGTALVYTHINNKVHQTHREWMRAVFGVEKGNEVLKASVRGYRLDGRMMVYGVQGRAGMEDDEFSGDVNLMLVLRAFIVMNRFASPTPIEEIGLGATPGPNQPWEARRVMSVVQLLKETAPEILTDNPVWVGDE